MPEGNLVHCRITSDLAGDTTFLAPGVPITVLAAAVTLPGGEPAIDAGASVTARCIAVPVRTGESSAAWRGVPVTVKVELAGYESAEFEWRADRPEVERRVLVPAVPE